MTFNDNTTETDNASVRCTGRAPDSQPSPSPGAVSPLCPPVCAPADTAGSPLAPFNRN